jgi:type VI protein secretion system component Hcp
MTEDEVKLCKTISKLTGILYEACEENRELKEMIKSQREQITQLNAELKKGIR